MTRKTKYEIQGYIGTRLGDKSYRIEVKSTKSLGQVAEQFAKDNPDCTVEVVRNVSEGQWVFR